MEYSEYLESQRVKYARKKSYFNFYKEYQNGWFLFVFRSKHAETIVSFGNSQDFGNNIAHYKHELECYGKNHKPVVTDEKSVYDYVFALLKAMKREKYKSVSNSTFHFLISESFCYRVRGGEYEGLYAYDIDRINCDISQNEYCNHDEIEHNLRVNQVEKALSTMGIIPSSEVS